MPEMALWHDPQLMARSRIAPCGKAQANKAAAVLIGGYPAIKTHDPKMFAQHIIQLLSEYPVDLVEKAAFEVPRSVGYLTVAALREWLEGQMRDRRLAHAEAVREAERLRNQSAERARDLEVLEFKAQYISWLRDNPKGTVIQFAKQSLGGL